MAKVLSFNVLVVVASLVVLSGCRILQSEVRNC